MTDLEQASAIANICLAAFTLLTLGVLVWYTIETRTLRCAAQKQVEVMMMPILTFDSLSTNGGIESPVLRNVGTGTAFNIEIGPLGQRWKCRNYPSVLAAGQKANVTLVLHEEQRRFSISYQGPTGKTYRSTLSVERLDCLGDLPRVAAIDVKWHNFETD